MNSLEWLTLRLILIISDPWLINGLVVVKQPELMFPLSLDGRASPEAGAASEGDFGISTTSFEGRTVIILSNFLSCWERLYIWSKFLYLFWGWSYISFTIFKKTGHVKQTSVAGWSTNQLVGQVVGVSGFPTGHSQRPRRPPGGFYKNLAETWLRRFKLMRRSE